MSILPSVTLIYIYLCDTAMKPSSLSIVPFALGTPPLTRGAGAFEAVASTAHTAPCHKMVTTDCTWMGRCIELLRPFKQTRILAIRGERYHPDALPYLLFKVGIALLLAFSTVGPSITDHELAIL